MTIASRIPIALAGLGAMSLAACVPPAPEPTPAPSPAPTAQPQAAPPQVVTPTYDNWMDAPATPGDWIYQAGGATTRAVFGSSPAAPVFTISCDRNTRTIALTRIHSGQIPQPSGMNIRTETRDRSFGAVPGGNAMTIVTTLPASDPFLEAIAFSKGRFYVDVLGTPPLYIPAWPEITRVIEDCR